MGSYQYADINDIDNANWSKFSPLILLSDPDVMISGDKYFKLKIRCCEPSRIRSISMQSFHYQRRYLIRLHFSTKPRYDIR